MKVLASLGGHLATSMSVQVAEEHILCPGASSMVRVIQESLPARGKTPMRVERMRLFLGQYPDRAAAQLLDRGLQRGSIYHVL